MLRYIKNSLPLFHNQNTKTMKNLNEIKVMKDYRAIYISYKQIFTNHVDFDSTFDKIVSTVSNLYKVNLLDMMDNGIFVNEIEDVENEYEIGNMLLFLDDELISLFKSEMEDDENIEIFKFEDVTSKVVSEDKSLIDEFSLSDDYIFEYKKVAVGKDGILDKIIASGIDSLTEIDTKVLEG